MSGRKLRVAVFGCGYWANFQIPAWQSLGVEVVAAWNRTNARAEAAARRWGIPRVYTTPEEVFEREDFDIADIIADVDAHEPLVRMAARHGRAVICQKPMAGTLDGCRRMVQTCQEAGVWVAIHENFRYQPHLVAVQKALESGVLGRLSRAHLTLKSPDRAIMEKQPALAQMDHMSLRDMGPHIFDVARRWFGEARSVYSLPIQSYSDIPVQDSALTILEMEAGFPVQCDLVHNWQYRLFAEGEKGTMVLDRDLILHIDTNDLRQSIDTKTWHKLDYIPDDDWQIHGGHVFASIPACLTDLIDAFRRGVPAPTSGEDNLKTMLLVFAAMRSWDEGRAITCTEMERGL